MTDIKRNKNILIFSCCLLSVLFGSDIYAEKTANTNIMHDSLVRNASDLSYHLAFNGGKGKPGPQFEGQPRQEKPPKKQRYKRNRWKYRFWRNPHPEPRVQSRPEPRIEPPPVPGREPRPVPGPGPHP